MSGDSFLRFFPVPRYLRFPAVGVDISDGSVKFIELIESSGSVNTGRFGRRFFSEGTLIEVLSSIQREFNFDLVNVSAPEEESYFIRIRLPVLKTEDIRDAIELQIEGYVPYSAKEVEFDYQVLKNGPKKDGHVDVNVAVLPKKIVNKYVSLLSQSGLRLMSLMIEAEATSRAAVPWGDKNVSMIVNIGRVNTILSIVANGVVWFSYTFGLGGNSLTKRLCERYSLSGAEAERLKNESGLLGSTSDGQNASECLLPMFAGVKDEMEKHRRYWSEHRKGFLMAQDLGDVNRVMVCGSQAVIPGLIDYLSSALKMEVALVNPWVNLFDFDQYVPPINRGDSLEYTTAIGLALGSLFNL